MRPLKTILVLGFATTLLVLVLVLPHGGTSTPARADSGQPALASQTVEAPGSSLRRAPRLRPASRAGDVQPLSALLATIAAETDLDLQSDALERLVNAVPQADLRGTLDACSGLDGPLAAEFRKRLLRRWAEGDAASAAAWAAQLPPGPDQSAAWEQVAIAWGNQDPSAAANWLQSLPASDAKQAATLALAYETTRSEPVAALNLGVTLPSSPERDALLVHAASEWGSRDATAATAWASAVTDPTLRNELLAGIALATTKQDPVAAATLALDTMAPGESQDRTVVAIVERWAETEPQAAGAWVAQFPDTAVRQEAAENLLSVWTPTNPQGAATWLAQQPDDFWLQASAAASRSAAQVQPAAPLP